MLKWFKKKPADEWERLWSDTYELIYPKHYTTICEGGPYVNALSLSPPRKTIGVLRFTILQYKTEAEAQEILKGTIEKVSNGKMITLGQHQCWFEITEKKHTSSDYIFWTDTGEPILMYAWYFTHGRHLFFFSYRIPLSYTVNGKYETERPVIEKIIASCSET